MSYCLPARLAHLYDEAHDVLYLADLPDGVPVLLEGPAALIWLTAVGAERPSDPGEVASLVADAVGLPVAQVRDDVESFLGQLIDQGLLEQST